MPNKGVFIVVDGGDGSGKTTQLSRAKEFFGDRAVFTREPGGSLFAEKLRDLLFSEEFGRQADNKTRCALFWAARADHIKNVIKPALDAGKIVISDRFDSSTFAYQVFGQDDQMYTEPVFWATRTAYLKDCEPDMYIYLNVDPKIGQDRKMAQKVEVNHYDEGELEVHHKRREGYFYFLRSILSHKYDPRFIDANLPEDKVWEIFKHHLQIAIGDK